MQPTTTYRAVYQLYTSFLDWTQGSLRDLAYAIVCPPPKVVATGNGALAFSTHLPIHCIDWPLRPGSRKRLDILLSVEETIDIESGHYTWVRVRLNYLRKKATGLKAVESLRYDCEIPARSQHPLYHAQTSDELVAPLPESLVSEVDRSPIQTRHDRIRIPSAFVNLPAVLAILASDHLNEEHWQDFMPSLVERCEHFPRVPEPTLVSRLRDQAIPGAWHWYELGAASSASKRSA